MVTDASISEAIVDHAVSEAFRAAAVYLDAYLDDETISTSNADNIALGIIAAFNREALYMDDGYVQTELSKRLYDRYGPAKNRSND
jgi:polysaccharide deacetylase 2 family uncharacterized protein YibQ